MVSKITGDPSNVMILVRDPSDPAKAAEGLSQAVAVICQSMSAQVGHHVAHTPSGPFVWIDADWASQDQLRTLPEIIVRHLEDAGVVSATVTTPLTGGPTSEVGRFPHAVLLRMFPPPPQARDDRSVIPEPWLEEAYAWLREDRADADVVWVGAGLMGFQLPVNEGLGFFRQARFTGCRLATGPGDPRAFPVGATWFGKYDPLPRALEAIGRRARVVNFIGSIEEPHLALGFGGPDVRDDDLLAAFSAFSDLARRFAGEVAYAFVEMSPVMDLDGERSVLNGDPLLLWPICDEVVFDAFPFQILGPGHLEQLGGLPHGARPLPGGRAELSLGEPSDWLWLARAAPDKDWLQRRATLLQDTDDVSVRLSTALPNVDLTRLGIQRPDSSVHEIPEPAGEWLRTGRQLLDRCLPSSARWSPPQGE